MSHPRLAPIDDDPADVERQGARGDADAEDDEDDGLPAAARRHHHSITNLAGPACQLRGLVHAQVLDLRYFAGGAGRTRVLRYAGSRTL